MKKFAFLFLAVLMVSCSMPPKAEMDKAKAAITRAEAAPDVVTYAAADLQAAKKEYETMTSLVASKNYPQAKEAALQIVDTINKAVLDANLNKERSKSAATSNLVNVEKYIPEIAKLVKVAKTVQRIKLDFAAIDNQFAAIVARFDASKTKLNDGFYKAAEEELNAEMTDLADIQTAISNATMLATRKK